MTFNQFCGKYGVYLHHLKSIVQNTAADHLGSPPTSYVLELTGFHQGIFKVLYSIRAKECKITMCNTDNFVDPKYNGFLLVAHKVLGDHSQIYHRVCIISG